MIRLYYQSIIFTIITIAGIMTSESSAFQELDTLIRKNSTDFVALDRLNLLIDQVKFALC